MPIALDQLLDDVHALKSLVADQLVRNEQLQADKQAVAQRNEQLTTENQHYKAIVRILSDKDDLGQLWVLPLMREFLVTEELKKPL